MAILFLFFLIISSCSTIFAAPSSGYKPADNILIGCGGLSSTKTADGRVFKSDQEAIEYLETKEDIQIHAPQSDEIPSIIYLTARIFHKEAIYKFLLSQPGFHWIRLHFYTIPNDEFDLKQAIFSVHTPKIVLLHNFKMSNNNNESKGIIQKEYLINITDPQFHLTFKPMKDSVAFINAIEVVSAPEELISDTGTSLFPVNAFAGLSNFAYQTIYRVNVGGPLVTPLNDTLARIWIPDYGFLKDEKLSKDVFATSSNAIKYPSGVTPLIAPPIVYATAKEMANSDKNDPKVNLTWSFPCSSAYHYLIRLHFCDIVSKSLNDLYFNVYINGLTAISGVDLSTIAGDLGTPYYRDIVVNSTVVVSSEALMVQIGPMNEDTGSKNAILNGVEVLRMSNSVDSLDGEFGVDGRSIGMVKHGVVATAGFVMMFGAFIGLGSMVYKWKKRPQDWQKRNSFSSWLLPIHAGDSSFMSTSKTSIYNSSTLGLGRYFTLSELQDVTKNFDASQIIGVGGFGNVYIGKIDDGKTEVAIKRGNPQSEQGITEFQTEIQMLSKLRHRHLVSLIGYCNENSEMILVYEYMSNGAFRDHLYGEKVSVPLTWKQRLEICIGAARGLHYLHTGTAQGIIHRDVKSTNILLDEELVAKVADFGLSKDVGFGQKHVSTAVKGSLGYLDPEYFRRQQLTDKSDVYSFGVVLLEALCARTAIDPTLPREEMNLAEWVMKWKKKGLLEETIDKKLVCNENNPESMKKFVEAAEKCLAEYGVDRPTMGDVLWNLEYALQLQDAFSARNGEVKENETGNPAAATTEK